MQPTRELPEWPSPSRSRAPGGPFLDRPAFADWRLIGSEVLPAAATTLRSDLATGNATSVGAPFYHRRHHRPRAPGSPPRHSARRAYRPTTSRCWYDRARRPLLANRTPPRSITRLIRHLPRPLERQFCFRTVDDPYFSTLRLRRCFRGALATYYERIGYATGPDTHYTAIL